MRTLYGYTCPGFAGHGLPGHALVKRMLVAGRVVAPGIAIAHTSLLNDPAAMIVEFSTVEAMMEADGLWDHLLLLSPKRGALLTSSPHAAWETLLTRQGRQGGDGITNVSWRHSTRGGRAWALPQTLSSAQAALMTNVWTENLGTSRTTLHIQIRGDTTMDPGPWIRWLAERAVQLLPSAGEWTTGTMGCTPVGHQITAVAGCQDDWGGGLLVTANSEEEAAFLAARLNGLCAGGANGPTRLGVRASHALDAAPRRARTGATSS